MAEATLFFPKDFRWGTATAAHQVEGKNLNNDWYRFEELPGRIYSGQRSGIACNWWEAAEQDFDRMVEMGQNAHRMSVEWSRIEPEPDHFDDAALARYREMLRGLRQRGIEPMVTLHHFTNPIWLSERGGWENPATSARFALFTARTVEALGDYCDLWCTINEPMVYVYEGWSEGLFPPAKKNNRLGFRVAANMVRGHSLAYRAIHDIQPTARVGIAHHVRLFQPARPGHPFDRLITRLQSHMLNTAWLQSCIDGRLHWPIGNSRVPGLAGSLDFIGLNYYTRDRVAFDIRRPATFFGRNFLTPDAEMSDNHYGENYPEGLYLTLKWLARYKKPIYITENGVPDHDDDLRPRFLIGHLHQVWRAIQFNWPVMGYYHWTLVDNFEWAAGWSLRFGLIELDPETQERRMRRSGELYSEICHTGTLSSDMVSRYTPELKDAMFPG